MAFFEWTEPCRIPEVVPGSSRRIVQSKANLNRNKEIVAQRGYTQNQIACFCLSLLSDAGWVFIIRKLLLFLSFCGYTEHTGLVVKTSSQQGPLNNCYKAFKVNSKVNLITCSAPSSYDSCRCSTFIFICALKPAHTDRPSYFNLANLLANMNSYKHPANRTALNLVQCPPNEYNSCIDSLCLF